MSNLETQIDTLRAELSGAIAAAQDQGALEAARLAALGKKGSVSALLASLGSMAPDERKSAGPAINGLKTEIAALIEAKGAELADKALNARLAAEKLDVTLPLQPAPTARGPSTARRWPTPWAGPDTPTTRGARSTTT